jgi:serine/threonine protein kinase
MVPSVRADHTQQFCDRNKINFPTGAPSLGSKFKSSTESRNSSFFGASWATQTPNLTTPTLSPSAESAEPPDRLDLAPLRAPRFDPTSGFASPACTANLELRLFTVPSYSLGYGRHADVFLAAYRPSDEVSPRWTLCAAKRVHSDRDSQTAGLSEAFVLTRLGSNTAEAHPNIIRLIGIKDERDIERSSYSEDGHARVGLGLGVPSRSHVQGSGHGRSFSDMSASGNPQVVVKSVRKDDRNAPNAQRPPPSAPNSPSQVRRALSVRDGLGRSGTPDVASIPGPSDSPRVILLLEYCSFGTLDAFARLHRDQINHQLFFRIATGLADAVAFCHSRGILHADIKPQNALVSPLASSAGFTLRTDLFFESWTSRSLSSFVTLAWRYFPTLRKIHSVLVLRRTRPLSSCDRRLAALVFLPTSSRWESRLSPSLQAASHTSLPAVL